MRDTNKQTGTLLAFLSSCILDIRRSHGGLEGWKAFCAHPVRLGWGWVRWQENEQHLPAPAVPRATWKQGHPTHRCQERLLANLISRSWPEDNVAFLCQPLVMPATISLTPVCANESRKIRKHLYRAVLSCTGEGVGLQWEHHIDMGERGETGKRVKLLQTLVQVKLCEPGGMSRLSPAL